MLWDNRKLYSKKLFSLNFKAMADNNETYETANVEIKLWTLE
jgi:hypothetical protein